MPPAAQIREALQRVVSSDAFARSERARDLLRYLVEQDLAGHADRLKGYSVAVDVFGKDASFDPSTDTVVRVQAGRLRELLQQYYAGEGAHDLVRITVPRGSYVPLYVAADGDAALAFPEVVSVETPAEQGQVTPLPPRISAADGRRSWIAYGFGALFLAGVMVGTVLQWGGGSKAVPEVQAANVAAVPQAMESGPASVRQQLPAIYLKVAGKSEAAETLAAVFRRGLAGFDTVSFIAREPDSGSGSTHPKTDFVFTLKSDADDAVHIELQNIASGTVLLSRNLVVKDRPQNQIEDEVADLLTSVTPVSGILFAGVAQDGAETPLIRCLILNELFYRNPNATAHQEVYACLQEFVTGDVTSSLAYSELAGLHMQAIAARYAHLKDASEAQALAFARMAVQFGPNSPYAHRSMGYVLSRSATPDEAMRWTRKAYELNMFDLGMAASYGYELIFDGLYDEGTPILKRAVQAASAHPPWWDYGLALGQLMRNELREAANAVSVLSASPRAHYRALRLVVAHELDRQSEVERLLEQMRIGNKSFVADPLGFFRRGLYPEDLTERLMQSLTHAGLVDAS